MSGLVFLSVVSVIDMCFIDKRLKGRALRLSVLGSISSIKPLLIDDDGYR